MSSDLRANIVYDAATITAAQRYVPYAICRTCMRHVYPEQHKTPGHDVATLTLAERDAVAAIHEAANKADVAATKAFRRL